MEAVAQGTAGAMRELSCDGQNPLPIVPVLHMEQWCEPARRSNREKAVQIIHSWRLPQPIHAPFDDGEATPTGHLPPYEAPE